MKLLLIFYLTNEMAKLFRIKIREFIYFYSFEILQNIRVKELNTYGIRSLIILFVSTLEELQAFLIGCCYC